MEGAVEDRAGGRGARDRREDAGDVGSRERLARAREQEEATREQVVFAAQAEAQLLLQRKAKLQETLRQLRASGEGVAARAQRLQVVSSAK